MEYRLLGRTDLKVSLLCLGAMQCGWTAGETMAQRLPSAAYEAGVNFFIAVIPKVSQVALARLLPNPVITSPIMGVNSPEQLRDNLGAMNVHMINEEKSSLEQGTAWKEEGVGV